MKNWFKRNKVNILIACVIGIPISMYGISQQPKQMIAIPQEVIEYQETSENDLVDSFENVEAYVSESSENVIFFDVPLSEELQIHIFEECKKHNLSPSIVIAMIESESSYKSDAIGDNGNSFGLMQIQPKWNIERMNRLGCTDLMDPFQNVTVGIDILAELIEVNADLYWVLMAYNGWIPYANERLESGDISDYAIAVVERASELEVAVQND